MIRQVSQVVSHDWSDRFQNIWYGVGDDTCDSDIDPSNQDQYIVWANGGLGETAFIHFNRADGELLWLHNSPWLHVYVVHSIPIFTPRRACASKGLCDPSCPFIYIFIYIYIYIYVADPGRKRTLFHSDFC